jgi:hypothetical protein
MEWEYAPIVEWQQVSGRMGDDLGVWMKVTGRGCTNRNRRLVRWTEEHCGVKP